MRSSVRGAGRSSGRPLDPRSRSENRLTGAMPLETERGVWFVGVGPSEGMAGALNLDAGIYFTSEDGFNWDQRAFPSPRPDDGLLGSGYANGLWVACGIRIGSGLVLSTTDPTDSTLWKSDRPYGFEGGTVAVTPASYDNDAGLFTVPIGPLGSVTIQNDAAPADPEDTTWPHQGADYLSSSVLGFGSQGLVEVRVTRMIVNVHAGDILISGGPVPTAAVGTWPTDFLEAKKHGSAIWTPVFHGILDGTVPDDAGIVLRGLVWGVVQKAVEFAPGND